VGSSVAAGEVCVVLEAMKMETPVVAPCAGVVCAVRAVTSQLSSAGNLLLVIRTQEEGTEAAAAE
ncbi:urea amidolyase, partial [Haematococcus lacustris]